MIGEAETCHLEFTLKWYLLYIYTSFHLYLSECSSIIKDQLCNRGHSSRGAQSSCLYVQDNNSIRTGFQAVKAETDYYFFTPAFATPQQPLKKATNSTESPQLQDFSGCVQVGQTWPWPSTNTALPFLNTLPLVTCICLHHCYMSDCFEKC